MGRNVWPATLPEQRLFDMRPELSDPALLRTVSIWVSRSLLKHVSAVEPRLYKMTMGRLNDLKAVVAPTSRDIIS